MLVQPASSLTRRTLLRIAVTAGLGIVLATGVTYLIVYDAIESLRVELLSQYVVERAQREETRFLAAESNLRVLKGKFIERLQTRSGSDRDPRAWFETHFARTADGAMRSRRELVDPTRQASTWIRAGTPVTDELQRLILTSHELCEQYFGAWREQMSDLYVTSPLQFNTGVAPDLPEWVWQIAADFDQNAFEWGVLGGVAANPERAPRWTGVLFDVSSPNATDRVAFSTLCVPVDVDGRHLFTLHADVIFSELLETVLRPERPGVTHAVFRDDGRLIAHAELWSELVAREGRVFLQQSSNAPLRSIHTAVMKGAEPHGSRVVAGYDAASQLYFAARRLRGPEWWLVSLLPRTQVRDEAFRSAQWVLWIGLAALGFVLGTLALILRHEIALPLSRLSMAARRLAAGETGTELLVSRPDELGELAASFNEMTRRVAERDQQLRQLNQDLEHRIEERTAELVASESRVRAILENAPEAIVVIDADTGKYVHGNENALRFLGVDRATLQDGSPFDARAKHQPDGQLSATVARTRMDAAMKGETQVFEWLYRPASGPDVLCEIRLSRLPSNSGRLVIGTITDISSRKQAEQALLQSLAHERQLGEMKSGFVSTVSHEFRTPLGVILSSTEILLHYFDRLTSEKRNDHLRTIVRSVRSLSRLVEEVLLLGRVEAGRLKFVPGQLDLPPLCDQLVDEARSSSEVPHPISLDLDPDLSNAVGDENLLRHIVGNLLSNAAKYSPAGSPITFSVRRADELAVFTIADRGIGIPEDDRKNLFQAFHRGRNVGQRAGSGLGLVIVRSFVQQHAGDIDIQSEVGVGTTVIVRLPLFGRFTPVTRNRFSEPTTQLPDSPE